MISEPAIAAEDAAANGTQDYRNSLYERPSGEYAHPKLLRADIALIQDMIVTLEPATYRDPMR